MLNTDVLLQLPISWREQAELLREFRSEQAAAACEKCANELEAAVFEWTTEELTLKEASEESGVSYSQLQALVANGNIENMGRKGKPRVRRRDVIDRRADREDAEPGIADRLLKAR